MFNADLLSTVLPSLLLVAGWGALLARIKRLPYTFALLGMAGTTAHELMHFVVGFLLGARPVRISLFPVKEASHWVLGSVVFERLTIWNSAFVAFAPLLLIPLSVLLFRECTLPALTSGNLSGWALSGYGVASLLFSAVPSSTDFRIGGSSLMLYIVIGIFGHLLLA